VHEVAQQADPAARVVYVDVDPVAIAHSRAILAGNENATIIEADLRGPEKILADPATARLIDLAQPVALLLAAVLHFISDAENPWQIVATLRDALAPGSYLVVSHGTDEGRPDVARAGEKLYRRSVSGQLHMRPRADILRFFDGFELLAPGLVTIPHWRPDAPVADDTGQVLGRPGRRGPQGVAAGWRVSRRTRTGPRRPPPRVAAG
jgi:hypothetical protein